MTILPERDYDVRLIDLPPGIPGFVRQQDDFYTIVLNSRLTRERNQKTFEHDRGHLINDDYEKKDADAIERKSRQKGVKS